MRALINAQAAMGNKQSKVTSCSTGRVSYEEIVKLPAFLCNPVKALYRKVGIQSQQHGHRADTVSM
jgi:hypothetical protein